MNQVISVPRDVGRETIHLSAVSWRTYLRLVRTFEAQPGVHLTYDCGELEIMSPHLTLDGDGRLLGALVLVLAEELEIPLKHGGSTTLRLKQKKRGLAPDECLWLANAPKMAGRRQLDLRRDPPPDLAIDVDVPSNSMHRLPIYAALGVPEVWRLEGESLTFHVLEASGTYDDASASRAFPFVETNDILRFLLLARDADDENIVVREFREWIRLKRASGPSLGLTSN